jgi:hypothetical protein
MTTALSQSLLGITCDQGEETLGNRPLIVFDGGNRTLQWIDPWGEIHTIPSFIKVIDPSWEDVEPDDRSIIIESEGETFVVGQLAKEMKGIPVFQDDKVKLASRLVLIALQPNQNLNTLHVERLLMALPNARNQEDVSYLKAIEGTRTFIRNGQVITANISRIEPIDETKAAYTYAMQQGLYMSKRNPNGVLDLGGGTSILRLYSVSGALMREADLILPGTYDLARRIAARITRDLPISPDLSLIMDGIEAGNYEIGTTGYCFQAAFESARHEWLNEIRGQIRTRWTQWLATLGEVIIIGGSAPLATPLEKATRGRFKIIPNPQSISIRGMVTYGN